MCCHLGNYEYSGEANSYEEATGDGETQRGEAEAELKNVNFNTQQIVKPVFAPIIVFSSRFFHGYTYMCKFCDIFQLWAEAEESKGVWELVKEKPNQHLEALKRV